MRKIGNKHGSLRLGYGADLETLTLKNKNYRNVLYTTPNMQLVLMSLLPFEEIGMEKHPSLTQFIRFEKGHGKVTLGKSKYLVNDGDVIIVPPNTQHNIQNLSLDKRLQLYTIYSPPEHKPNLVERYKNKH